MRSPVSPSSDRAAPSAAVVLCAAVLALTTAAPAAARDDDPVGDVYVAVSDGSRFAGDGWLWHEFFGLDGEVPMVGDVNGDKKDDLVTFTKGTKNDVMVALSTGEAFGPAGLWHDFFAIGAEIPLLGDVNGDGQDDIVTVTKGTKNDVIVALSTGSGFGPATVWHDFFCIGNEVPLLGDFDGDGKDDIATFTRGSSADVIVARSTGARFDRTARWHDWFAVGTETPGVGDVNGDGRDDIITFTRGTAGDVYVSQSDGDRFVESSRLWHDWFAFAQEVPAVADVSGDGRDDVVVFTRGDRADVYAAISNGAAFIGTTSKWHDMFAAWDETARVGDVNGDGKADIVTFLGG